MHAILDTATDGVAVVDADGRILSLNRSGEALFGCDGAEVAGQHINALIDKDSQAIVADYFAGVKAGASPACSMTGARFQRARARAAPFLFS